MLEDYDGRKSEDLMVAGATPTSHSLINQQLTLTITPIPKQSINHTSHRCTNICIIVVILQVLILTTHIYLIILI